MRNQEQKSKEHSTDRPGLFGVNYIMPFIRPYGRKIVVMLLLGFLSSLADTIFPLFNRYAPAGIPGIYPSVCDPAGIADGH